MNVENTVPVELRRNGKVLPTNDVDGVVNLYEVFEKEREESNRYRLVFTVNTVCTNVLFNTLTEVVSGEGSSNVVVLENPVDNSYNVTVPNATNDNASRDTNRSVVTRAQAVRNTEYSNKKCGFDYHCGYDIFNNHTLRCLTFKTVCRLNNPSRETKVDYNTIYDYLRRQDGGTLTFSSRVSGTEMDNDLPQHLYEYEDLSDFLSTVSDQLVEKDGWFGFTNVMKVPTSASPDLDDCVNKTINSKEACEFIDMYPDRTLYSFVPKVNTYRKRLEKNWHYCLTFPYSSSKNHVLVNKVNNNGAMEDDGTHCYNGLLINTVSSGRSYTGQEVVYFWTVCRHNLRKGDKVVLIDDDTSLMVGGTYDVTNVGDVNRENTEHCFYVNRNELPDDFFDNGIPNTRFRFRKRENGKDCEYYVRVFRKLPNFKNAREKLDADNSGDPERYDELLRQNTIGFDDDLYKLGFARNIYSDDEAQITVTDDVDVSYLKDNLGRPLTTIYLTVVKNNAGYKEWYGTKENGYRSDYGNENVEFSHCFGEVSSGFDLPYDSNDRSWSNVHYLDNVQSRQSQAAVPLERDITLSGSSLGESLFYGDIVELSPVMARETVIEPVCYRFNTAQRETSNPKYASYEYDMMLADDFDIRNTTQTSVDGGGYAADGSGFWVSAVTVSGSSTRPEGYYYKAHYPIRIKALGDTVYQGTAESLRVLSVESAGGSAYRIRTRAINYVEQGETIVVTELRGGKEVNPEYCKVSEVADLVTFTMSCPYDLTNVSASYVLRRRNYAIPSYAIAMNDGSGRCMWREVYANGDNTDADMEEYPFANGAFYVHTPINLYLLRQDPFNEAGLRATTQTPADQPGNRADTENYEYFEEEEKLC